MKLAPIILFVYNRLEHTVKTVQALQNNHLALQSELYVFCDGPKTTDSRKDVELVRSFIRTIKGFKSVTIKERSDNIGLAQSIIEGVSEVINIHGRAIVLEDDIVTSSSFLDYMNHALDQYQNEQNIWHVSGWNYPISATSLGDAFFWRVMNCWGWATWSDRWQFFNKDAEYLVKAWSDQQKRDFDLDSSGIFWPQVEQNHAGKLNTWAIFWYAIIFEHGGLCLNPSQSYTLNIGLDGSGENCGNEGGDDLSVDALCQLREPNLPHTMIENKTAVTRIKRYYRIRRNIFFRIYRKARVFFGKKS